VSISPSTRSLTSSGGLHASSTTANERLGRERAIDRFGEQGVIETVSLVGYYTMISLILNTARTPLPDGAEPALPAFPF
jgi:hypothetical protein